MNDINLLPDDLRGEEERSVAKSERRQGGPEAAGFYIPQNGQASGGHKPASLPPKIAAIQQLKSTPLPSVSQKSSAIPVTVSKPELQAPPRQPSPKKGGLFKGLFGRKNKSGQAQPAAIPSVVSSNGFSGNGLDVNLIPEGAHLSPLSKFTPGFVLSILVGVFLLALAFLGINLYQQKINQQQEILSAKLAEGELQYRQLKARETEIKRFTEQLEAVAAVLDRHAYWSNFFYELEQITLPEVYFSSITFSLDGYVSLSATSDTYVSIARQWKVYENSVGKILKEFAISGLNGDQDSGKISFSASLLLRPEVYFINLTMPEAQPALSAEAGLPTDLLNP